jgi:hypothetical protein
VILLALAVTALEPAKLVIVSRSDAPTTIPYSSLARCERARASLMAQQKQVIEESHAGEVIALPNGGYEVKGVPPIVKAYCIPG